MIDFESASGWQLQFASLPGYEEGHQPNPDHNIPHNVVDKVNVILR